MVPESELLSAIPLTIPLSALLSLGELSNWETLQNIRKKGQGKCYAYFNIMIQALHAICY